MTNIDVKHFICECKQAFTVEPTKNKIANEFSQLKKIKQFKNPEVIDENTKELRSMNPVEKTVHLQRLDNAKTKIMNEYKIKFPKNNVTVRKTNEGVDVVEYSLDMDPVYGIMTETKKEITVKCPSCQKVAYRRVLS